MFVVFQSKVLLSRFLNAKVLEKWFSILWSEIVGIQEGKVPFQCFHISEIKSDFKSSNKENMPFEVWVLNIKSLDPAGHYLWDVGS